MSNIVKKIVSNDNFIMQPKVDYAFKEIMADEEVRKGFLAAVLGVSPNDISKTELLPTIIDKHYEDDKLSVLDVRVLFNSNEYIDMEMQVGNYAYWRERSTYYLGKMYVEQLKEGQDYDNLKKCIHISILNFELFPEEDSFYSLFHFREDSRNTLYTNKLEIHIIELPKVKKRVYPKNDLLAWSEFFNVESREELEAMISKNEYIDKACDKVIQLSADEEKRMIYEARLKQMRDHSTQMRSSHDAGYREGHAQGVVQGVEQGRFELLVDMYQNGEITEELVLEKLGITKEEFLSKYEEFVQKQQT